MAESPDVESAAAEPTQEYRHRIHKNEMETEKVGPNPIGCAVRQMARVV
jgi:hypothetical protein